MTRKKILRLLALLPVIIICTDIFARAGGGGGGGAGGGSYYTGGGSGSILKLILYLGIGLYTLVFFFILYFKTKKSKVQIFKNEEEDSFWNYDQMVVDTKYLFFQMQTAWMERNIDSVKHYITPKLYDDYYMRLERMRVDGKQNILKNIHVKKVRIIGCEDYADDRRDSYVAHIQGSILDYTINEQTRKIIKNNRKREESFTDIYYFVRKDDMWVLDNIDNKANIWVVLKTRIFREKNY